MTTFNLSEKMFALGEKLKSRALERAHPHVYVDGVYFKGLGGGSYENAMVMARMRW